MDYRTSIRTVNMYYEHWLMLDEHGDDVGGVWFDKLMAAKAAHRAAFGTLRRVEGLWV